MTQQTPQGRYQTWASWAIFLAFVYVFWFLNWPLRFAPYIATFILAYIYLWMRFPRFAAAITYGFISGLFGWRGGGYWRRW